MGEATVPAEQPATGQAAWVPAPDVDQSRSGHSGFPAPKGPRPPVGLIWRIGDQATFSAFRHAARARRGPVTVAFVPSSDPQPRRAPQPPRVAYAIGRPVGSAVVRNRVRRRLRAIMAAADLVPGAYLVGVGPAGAALRFSDLEAAANDAVRAAVRSAVALAPVTPAPRGGQRG